MFHDILNWLLLIVSWLNIPYQIWLLRAWNCTKLGLINIHWIVSLVRYMPKRQSKRIKIRLTALVVERNWVFDPFVAFVVGEHLLVESADLSVFQHFRPDSVDHIDFGQHYIDAACVDFGIEFASNCIL
jgi:hypothetical protein